jgi:hypothetical protein
VANPSTRTALIYVDGVGNVLDSQPIIPFNLLRQKKKSMDFRNFPHIALAHFFPFEKSAFIEHLLMPDNGL